MVPRRNSMSGEVDRCALTGVASESSQTTSAHV